ncbi:DUF4760 domain-containing protein [Paraburkholderia terrae]
MSWDRVINATIAAGTIVTSLTVVFAYFTYKDEVKAHENEVKAHENEWQAVKADHERGRRIFSMQIFKEYEETLELMRPKLIYSFSDLYDTENRGNMSQHDAKLLFQACDKQQIPSSKNSPKYTCEARGIASSYINRMEYIASAYDNRVADEKIIKDSLAHQVVEHYDYFRAFVNEVRTQTQDPEAWKPLENFVDEMKRQGVLPAPRPPAGP